MKKKILILSVAMLCSLSAWAGEKTMVALPKEPITLSDKSKEPVVLLHQIEQTEKVALPKRMIDRVHCNINSRYRSCF